MFEEGKHYKINALGCHEWIKSIGKSGYGNVKIQQRSFSAHRISYELRYGKFNKKLLVCHSCDNKKCINADHLWLGTHLNNNRDAINKGRIDPRKKNFARGEKKKNSQLTSDNVLNIRKLLKEKKYTQKDIGKMFGVKEWVINDINTKRKWGWLEDIG
jgi:hypothetical protein